ncbi:hypothetical protein RCG17_00565 [Neobacillus sp. PS3-12]|nr:hypothetical protein [Neobacillus sp. PS3-12]WML53243.1 hypothetical protein RCG17_00565 [Neobacillus sp. PS3-12]
MIVPTAFFSHEDLVDADIDPKGDQYRNQGRYLWYGTTLYPKDYE